MEKKNSFEIPLVTMVGALPPLKGNSYYCVSLATEIQSECALEFISFRRLYPDWIYPGGTLEEDHIEVNFPFQVFRLLDYYNPVTWFRAARKVRGRILHLQWWSIPTGPIYWVLLATALRKKKIVVTMHNVRPHEKGLFSKVFNRLMASRADRIIVHSRKNIQDVADNYQVPVDLIRLTPMAAHDNYQTADALTKEEARRVMGIREDARVVLFFGNVRPYKGLKDLLKAFSIMRSSPDMHGDAHLIIAGQCWGSWEPYQKLIDLNELKNHLTLMTDYVSKNKVAQLFISCDLVVCPYTHFDAQSGVGNIAIAFHKPLLVTQVGGLEELVGHPSSVVEPNCPEALARQMCKILEDSDLQKTLSIESEKRARENNWASMAKATKEIYDELCEVVSDHESRL